MKKTSYWLDTAKIKTFPPLGRDLEVDVLVVGAGLTGTVTAYLLKKAGLKVALLERERLAVRDTGHTTAHLTYSTDLRLHQLVKNFGREHAQAAWDAGAASIDQIEAIVHEEEIECEFTRVPGYLHAPAEGDLEKEKSRLQDDAVDASAMGFDATYLDTVPHVQLPGVRFANQAKFHPRKFLAHLVDRIDGDGSHIFEESPADEFDAQKKRVKVNGHWIAFDRVVLATHNPLVGLADITSATLFQTKLSLYSSYVVGGQIPRGALPVALFWDTNDPYNYWRVDRHKDFDYLIFGGEDHKTGQVTDTEDCFARVTEKFRKLAPGGRIDHRWSGQVIEASDGLPFIGSNAAGQFIGTAFSGNGMTFGTVTAIMARDWATGTKNPWTDLFEPERKKIKGAVWDYLRENKDYPYYLIKDRLARAEADSVRELGRNEGMILKSSAGKVAAYRDGQGNVHKCSAVCPHMGCTVHWNPAERTWDCPCHGSRFRPDGEVMAGPAEAPLKKI